MYDSNLVGRYTRVKCQVEEVYGSWNDKFLRLVQETSDNGFFFKEAGKSLDQALLFEHTTDAVIPPLFIKKIVEVGAFQFFRPLIFTDQYKDRIQSPILELFHVPSRSVITLDQLSESDLLHLVQELDKKPEKRRLNPEITEEDKARFQG